VTLLVSMSVAWKTWRELRLVESINSRQVVRGRRQVVRGWRQVGGGRRHVGGGWRRSQPGSTGSWRAGSCGSWATRPGRSAACSLAATFIVSRVASTRSAIAA